MSRCFPFPPGYEKKARIDDVDLLKKEKHKEKRHKKEKKEKEKREDRERREDKNRRDKDKSHGKHRDKKDRKEKSKEKSKDKERKKDRDKTSTSLETQIPALVESCNGGHKLNHKDRERVKYQNIISNEKKQNTPVHGYIGEKPVKTGLSNEGAIDKFVLDLCNRIKDEQKGYASQLTESSPFIGRTNHDRMVKTVSGVMPVEKEQREDKEADIRKMGGQGFSVDGKIGIKKETGIMPVEREKKENRRVDIRYMGGQGFSVGRAISVKNETGILPVEKEMNESKRVDIRNMGRQGVSVGLTFSASKLVPDIECKKNENGGANIGGGFRNRTEEIPRNSERSIEPRGTNHKKESEDKGGSKRKDKDKEKKKKNHGKDKEGENEKEKEEKVKEKNVQKIKDQDKVKDSIKNGFVTTQNINLPPLVPDGDRDLVAHPNTKLPQLVSNGDGSPFPGQNTKLPPFVLEGNRIPAVEVNLKKRKDTEVNEFLLETNVVPNKKARPAPHPSIENGRKLEPKTPVLHTPDRKVPPPNNLIKVNNNEYKVNGKIEVQSLSISLKKPSPSSSSSISSSSKTKADQIAKAPSGKPPHPDTKYLSKVLSVPKIYDCSDFDDEEWIFSHKSYVTISAGPTKALETPRVWAEAVQIESADICALPYVIPY